ncbi:MAG: hypothetical protein KME30_31145 [Iphinoe sp. HA4291-MV1]|nr:hypothetical protein [Iphinoe sp. HA4291-MV1]
MGNGQGARGNARLRVPSSQFPIPNSQFPYKNPQIFPQVAHFKWRVL